MKGALDTNKSRSLLAMAGDALAEAARLIAINGLLAESAIRRGDGGEAFAHLRKVADALDDARDVVALAGRISR
jgi:Flp pilus assembly protein TadD